MWEGLTPPYKAIVVDPPWAYRTQNIITRGHIGANAAAQYSTMTVDEITALPVSELADDNAHLYLWVTNPHLFEAEKIMNAWGFEYMTLITWVKTGTLGMGYYFRGMTEHVAFGVRGKLPIDAANRVPNVFTAAKGGHSVKPACLGDIVERVSPGPYVELFTRQCRLGWDSWGYGVEGLL